MTPSSSSSVSALPSSASGSKRSTSDSQIKSIALLIAGETELARRSLAVESTDGSTVGTDVAVLPSESAEASAVGTDSGPFEVAISLSAAGSELPESPEVSTVGPEFDSCQLALLVAAPPFDITTCGEASMALTSFVCAASFAVHSECENSAGGVALVERTGVSLLGG